MTSSHKIICKGVIVMGFRFNTDYIDELRANWNERVSSVKKKMLWLEILFLIIGVILLIFPIESVYVMSYIFAAFVIAEGIFGIVEFARMPIYLRTGGLLLMAMLNVIVGLMLITSPKEELAMIFGMTFSIEMLSLGIEEIALYDRMKFFVYMTDSTLLVNGIINILCAIMFFFMPYYSVVFLNILIAIYALYAGISLITMSVRAKKIVLKDESNVIDEQ